MILLHLLVTQTHLLDSLPIEPGMVSGGQALPAAGELVLRLGLCIKPERLCIAWPHLLCESL